MHTTVATAEHALPSYSTRPSSPTGVSTAGSESNNPSPTPTQAQLWGADYAELADEELPQYTRRDTSKQFRKASDPCTTISPEMLAIFEEERAERMRRQAARAARAGPIDKWVRWSAKFYMPMMGRWDHRKSI